MSQGATLTISQKFPKFSKLNKVVPIITIEIILFKTFNKFES